MPIPEPRPSGLDRPRRTTNCQVCGAEVVGSWWDRGVLCGRCVREQLVSVRRQRRAVPWPVSTLGDVLAGTGDTSGTGRLEGRPVAEMDEQSFSNRDDG